VPARHFSVLPYLVRIALVALFLHDLPLAASSAAVQPTGCTDPSVSTLFVCERVEIIWRRERARNFRPQPCQSNYKDGRKPTQQELANMLERHAEWLSVYAGRLHTQEAIKDHRSANLCGADLRDTTLAGVNLRGANLQAADLPRSLTGIILEVAELSGANFSLSHLDKAQLTGAHTTWTNFCGATLPGVELSPYDYAILIRASISDTKLDGTLGNLQAVDLCGAYLSTINLRGADIASTHFDGATLHNVDLSGAALATVDLSKARLLGVNLRGATLTDVDLREAYLDLKNAEDLQVIGSKGLASVTFSKPTAMVALRKFFKESGLRSEERAVTSALRKFALKTESIPAQYFAKYVLGGWITDYGANPWRSLWILGGGIPAFAVFYVWVLQKYERWNNSGKRAGIWAIWPADQIHKTDGKDPVRVTSTFFFPTWQARAAEKRWRRLRRWTCALLVGGYFSLLSAFHLGWRELTVGSWITHLQPREYTLRATGFVRFFSGLQSLISVYSLALWALTYFGRPFE
jgi:uncharacterized protein YjbI with pentapeptide repeats